MPKKFSRRTYDTWLKEENLFASKAQRAQQREQKMIDRIARHGRSITAGERDGVNVD